MEHYATDELQRFESDLVKACEEVTNNLDLYSSESEYQVALYRELTRNNYTAYMEVVSLKSYKGMVLDHGKNDRLDLTVWINPRLQVILELKSLEHIKDKHRYQLLTYLQCSDKNIPGYLINFNEKNGLVQIEKLIYRTEYPILQRWSVPKNPSTVIQFMNENDGSTQETTGKAELTKDELLKICKLLNIKLVASKTKSEMLTTIKTFLQTQ